MSAAGAARPSPSPPGNATNAPRAGANGLANDAWGGLAGMLVALPSSIAFGVLVYTAIGPDSAGEGALAGCLGAAVLGIIAPLVSRNGGFITAPCAPAAAVMAALAFELAAGNHSPERITLLLAVTALLSALLQLLYGAVGVGQLIKFIPYQVVSGYLSGVALIIAIGQLPRLLGLPKDVSLAHGLASPQLWSWSAIAAGAVTIVTTALAPRFVQRIPAAIIGLLAGIAAYFALAVFEPDLLKLAGNPLLIGPIETSGSFVEGVELRLAALVTVGPADVALVLTSALTLSVLLSIDTLKTGVVLDAVVHRRHDSNRELLGQGVANAAAVVAGGMPGAATMGATLVNVASGGRSPWSGVMEGAFVVAALALFSGLIAWVPIGALAGLLLTVAWRMFDRNMFRLALHRSTRADIGVIMAVMVVAQFGLIAAAVTGIGLAIMLFIRDQARSSVVVGKADLRVMRSKRRRAIAESALLDRDGDQALVVQLHGNLFFGTTDQLFSQLERKLDTLRYLLVDLRRVQSMDFTAAHLFEQMKDRLREHGGELLFSGMPSNLPTNYNVESYLAELGLVRKGGGIRVFDTRDGAIEWMEERILEQAGWEPQDEGPPLALEQMDLFSGFRAEEIAVLSGMIGEISVAAGEQVCAAGDRGDQMFMVRRGRLYTLLPLEGGKRHHLATFGPGDFFGELAFLDRQPRTADVEAATAASLFVLSRARFDHLLQSNPALGGKFFERLAFVISQRLRMADAELRGLEQR